jgi:hypothetical protein
MADGTKMAEFTFMFGYTNMGVICYIAGKRYLVKDVKEEEVGGGDTVVTITIELHELS